MTEQATGKITQIFGSFVDVRFPEVKLQSHYTALTAHYHF